VYRYVEKAKGGHIRHNLEACFELHRNLLQHGAMLPDLPL
jgi:acyl-CoA hydrolase